MFGIRILQDINCLEETDERLFPVSRHRSVRIHKKLLKRYGGEFRKRPTMFKIGEYAYVVHPALYAKLEAQLGKKIDGAVWNTMMYGTPTPGPVFNLPTEFMVTPRPTFLRR